jgi:hypothetical protein
MTKPLRERLQTLLHMGGQLRSQVGRHSAGKRATVFLGVTP